MEMSGNNLLEYLFIDRWPSANVDIRCAERDSVTVMNQKRLETKKAADKSLQNLGHDFYLTPDSLAHDEGETLATTAQSLNAEVSSSISKNRRKRLRQRLHRNLFLDRWPSANFDVRCAESDWLKFLNQKQAPTANQTTDECVPRGSQPEEGTDSDFVCDTDSSSYDTASDGESKERRTFVESNDNVFTIQSDSNYRK